MFTPLLHSIDDKKVEVYPYKAGSRGPAKADEMIAKAGCVCPASSLSACASLRCCRLAFTDSLG